DELAERRELLGLRQTLAQLLALAFELGAREQVARDHHASVRPVFAVDELRRRDEERAVEDRIDRLERGGRFLARLDRVHLLAFEPGAGGRADRLGHRAVDEVLARAGPAGG